MFALLVLLGLEMGAGCYEGRVVVPQWSADPQAAFNFFHANPAFALNAGPRWWIFLTPLTGLVALVAALLAGRLPAAQTKWVRYGGIVAFAMTVITFSYFVPTIMELQSGRVLRLTAEQARSKAALWAGLNWVRAAIVFTAWVLVIRGVSRGSAVSARALAASR